MPKITDLDLADIVKLQRNMVDLLSEYGVDRAGIDAAIDIAIEYGDAKYHRDCAETHTT